MIIDSKKLTLRSIRDVDDELLGHFDSGRPQLNYFLQQEARDYDLYGLTNTTLAFIADNSRPVAYFSLTADSVHLSNVERMELGLPFEASISFYPAVKITKLAVISQFQGKGIGKALINLICGIASEAPFAVRLLTVDAVNQVAVLKFYECNGFLESLSEQKERQNQRTRETILMFRDLYQ